MEFWSYMVWYVYTLHLRKTIKLLQIILIRLMFEWTIYISDHDYGEQLPMLEGLNFPTIQRIEAQGIYTLLFELEPHKASGPDGIPSHNASVLA